MDDLPADLREFLKDQPFLQLTEAKKIKCTLNEHELPCNLTEVQRFISGKKYRKLCARQEFNYSQYEPHLVPSTKQPNQIFCKLTLRHINRMPHHILLHVGGKRFKKALSEYEECVKQGIKFVPARLRQKKPPPDSDDGTESRREGKGKRRQKHNSGKQKQDRGIWAPSSSDGEGSDSHDSMSDLYPPSLFTVKTSEEQEKMEEDDEFQSADDDDDDGDMEVSDLKEKRASPKRKKVQSASFTKKFKKNRKKKGFKQMNRVKNGK